jgi:hypothetical protein
MERPMWKHAQVSVRGAAHLRNNLPCQDANGFLEIPGVLVCALADGAGSAARADRGSELAVEAALDHFLNLFLRATEDKAMAGLNADTGKAMLALVRERIATEASLEAADSSDYAATLLVAVITSGRSVFYQVGDGLWCVCRNAVLGAVTWPTGGEHVSETTFVTCDSAERLLQYASLPGGFDYLIGMTDGIERLALNLSGRVPHAGFFGPVADRLKQADALTFADQLTQFLASPPVCQRTDDDKTLAVILHESGI